MTTLAKPGRRFWAMEVRDLPRPHPQVKIIGRGGNYLVLTKVDADVAPSAEQSTAQGHGVLPIFIPQGWPQAMNHLSGIEG
jgi:hypothetical protein